MVVYRCSGLELVSITAMVKKLWHFDAKGVNVENRQNRQDQCNPGQIEKNGAHHWIPRAKVAFRL